MKLRPLGDNVVIEPLETESKTAGGIVLPDSAKEKSTRGTIIAVGKGQVLNNGKTVPLAVKKGDTVIYSKYGGSDVEVDGKELKILQESDILAVVS